jgi:triphosphoribosyl-dephospho-CoA synthase
MQACIAEVLSPKVGNVHPQADFDDVTWLDFVTSAIVISPILDRAGELGVGETILQCVIATRDAVGHNTNLGIILLMAPMCCVDRADQVSDVLAELTDEDTSKVYEAIRLASPGGLGHAKAADVSQSPGKIGLIEAMGLAADRDAIARQYVNDFADVFDHVMADIVAYDGPLDEAIVRAHLQQMAREPDSLILRKCGPEVAVESQRRARAVLAGEQTAAELDQWLRTDGHQRNPGTSADLIAAGLFAAMLAGEATFPITWASTLPWCS